MHIRNGLLKTLALLFAFLPLLSAWGEDEYFAEKRKILQGLGVPQGEPMQVKDVEDADWAKQALSYWEGLPNWRQILLYHYNCYQDLRTKVTDEFNVSALQHINQRSWTGGSLVLHAGESERNIRFKDVDWRDARIWHGAVSGVRYRAIVEGGDSDIQYRIQFFPREDKVKGLQKEYICTSISKLFIASITAESDDEIILVVHRMTNLPAGTINTKTLLADKRGERSVCCSSVTAPRPGHCYTVILVDDDEDEFVGTLDASKNWIFYNFKDGKLSVVKPRPSSPDRQPEPQTPSQGTIKQWLAMAAALSKAMTGHNKTRQAGADKR
ncbi:hypothetical protein A7Q09_02710 [Methylacidiphilum sp. Yel]|nr:hypothetical protein A7Q09_02710 [Methylacidiphilum sp. Yel]